MIRFTLGELQLTLIDGGNVWLDGGAMFGVVPRVLWERERQPDERHRIRLAMNLLLIEDGRRRVLVDAGAGSAWDDKSRAIYGLEEREPDDLLRPAGLAAADIDLVVCTHLHFDHAGGNTHPGPDGHPVAAFPNARYVIQRGELEMARQDNERLRASYQPRHFEPLAREADRVRLVDGVADLGGGVRVEPAPGHTPHMQIVLVDSGEGTIAFLADLVPTATHLRYPWIMGYDLEPLVTLASKHRILPRAVEEDWRVVFEHDAELPLARLRAGERWVTAHPWNGEG